MRSPAFRCTAAGVVLVAGWLIFRWWTYPPAVEFDNLRYLQQLSSAVSSRDEEWVGKVDEVVRLRHSDGLMSESELEHFQSIITTARSGFWDRADRECYAFAEAQLNRRRTKPPSDGHDH